MNTKTLQKISMSLLVTILDPLCISADEHGTSVNDSATQGTISSVSDSSTAAYAKLRGFLQRSDSLLDYCFAKDGEAFGHSAEGGEFKVYHHKSEPIMLHVTYYGERGKGEYSIYFEETNVKAVEAKGKFYNQSIDDLGELEIIEVETELMYFAESGEVFCFENNGTPIVHNPDSLAQDVEFYKEISQEYLKEAGF